MALERNLTLISLPAAADLSADQFHIVAIDASGRAALATGTVSKVIGVLYNKVSGTAYGAQVAIAGVARVVAGGSVAPGDYIVSDGAGFGIAGTGATSQVVGRCISNEATASGYIFECLLQPGMQL
jgi:hypothetical protein